MFGSPASSLRRSQKQKQNEFHAGTPPSKMSKHSEPPSLVSRNVLIDRYTALEEDSKKFDQHFHKSSSATPAHTPACREKEKTQRKRIRDSSLQKKRINADAPREVSVGDVGRELTLLTMAQQLDLNVCGTDYCSMNVSAARSQHVTDLVDHSRSDFHWKKNPFQQQQQQQQENQQERKKSPPAVSDKMIRSSANQISPADLAKAKRAGALESRLRRKFHLLMEDEKRQFQAELIRSGENDNEDELIQQLDDDERHLKPIILNRSASWQRLICIGLFASELKGQIEEVKATKLLRRVFARELMRYLRRKRIVNEKADFERKMAMAAFGKNESPPIGLLLKAFSVLKLDPEGYCSPAVMLVAALSSKRRVPLAKALAAFTNNHQAGSNNNNNDNNSGSSDDDDDDGQHSTKASNGGGGIGLQGMSRLRISPDHLHLIGSCFRRNVFKKREPICWSTPPSSSRNHNNQNSWMNNNSNDSSYPHRRNKDGKEDIEWWNECDAEIHLIQSGIVRMIHRHQRRDKNQALLLQQLSAQQQQSNNNNTDTKKKATPIANNKQNTNNNNNKSKSLMNKNKTGTTTSTSSSNNNDNKKASYDASRSYLRNTISGVETLTAGKIIGLEALVPEQAKRYIAVADSDVATWTTTVRELMNVMNQINPFGDPENAKNNSNDLFSGNNNTNSTNNTTSATSEGHQSSKQQAKSLLMSPPGLTATPEQVLAYKVEKESVTMLGKMMQRLVLLRKQEIFLAQSPPSPNFLRSCAPLLYPWSDSGLTELCRSLTAVFVEQGSIVPLRYEHKANKDNNNKSKQSSSSGHEWYYVGGATKVPSDISIPSSTAPPSHVDWVYFVVHGSVSIMGRKVYTSSSSGGAGGKTTNDMNNNNNDDDQQQQQSSSSGSSKQKLVVLDTMKPGQSFGVGSCLLGTLLDTAIIGAIASSICAAGTPTTLLNSNNNSSEGGSTHHHHHQNNNNSRSSYFTSGQHVANSASILTSNSVSSTVTPSQLSHLVGVELHSTQDSVLWRLEKNVLMHVLAHEHIGTLLSPFALYQQIGKQSSGQ